MTDPARLVLTNVRIGKARGRLYVFTDRLEVSTNTGERSFPIIAIERVAHRRSWRGARLLLALSDGQVIQVRGLGPTDATVAHRTILDLARAAH